MGAYNTLTKIFAGNISESQIQFNNIVHSNLMEDEEDIPKNNSKTERHERLSLILESTQHNYKSSNTSSTAIYTICMIICFLFQNLKIFSHWIVKPTIFSTHNDFRFGFEYALFGQVSLSFLENTAHMLLFLNCSGIIGMVYLLFNIDSKGRRRCVQVGSLINILCSVFFLIWVNVFKNDYEGVAIVFQSILNIGHYISFSIIPTLLILEFSPVKYRVIILSLFILYEYSINLLLTYVTLQIQLTYNYLMISCLIIYSVAYVLAKYILPETKKRTIEEIQAVLSNLRPTTPPASRSHISILTYGTDM